MSEYYVKYKGIIIFNDIDYSHDHEHWNNDDEWEPIDNHSQYLINAYGEVMRKSDSFLIPPCIVDDTETIQLISDDTHANISYNLEDLLDLVFADSTDSDTVSDDNLESANVQQQLDDLLTEISDVPVDIPVEVPVEVPVNVEQYLSNYPIIVTDNDGSFVQQYPSIRNMIASTHGTEGWDPMVIYNACNSPEWYKCYGKMIRWDQIMYIRHELEEKLRARRTD